VVVIVNFYGSLYSSYYFSVADVAIDVAVIANCIKQKNVHFERGEI
jgi:hypothetical protein